MKCDSGMKKMAAGGKASMGKDAQKSKPAVEKMAGGGKCRGMGAATKGGKYKG